jgi:hypothetical protein
MYGKLYRRNPEELDLESFPAGIYAVKGYVPRAWRWIEDEEAKFDEHGAPTRETPPGLKWEPEHHDKMIIADGEYTFFGYNDDFPLSFDADEIVELSNINEMGESGAAPIVVKVPKGFDTVIIALD